MDKTYLSLVIPCYNEERNIRLGALENVAHFLKKKKFKWEVIIADDGSTDESQRLIKDIIRDHQNFRLIINNHSGKAAAVTAGVNAACGEIILFSDLDQATPLNQIDKLLPFFSQGYDLVIGSRNSQRKGAPFFRLAMARGYMILRNLILNLGVSDTQCGFKAFSKRIAQEVFPRLKVFSPQRKASGSTVTAGFDVELLFLTKLHGFRIIEVPVEWHYQETRHINPLKDSWEGILDLVKIRWNNMMGLYNS